MGDAACQSADCLHFMGLGEVLFKLFLFREIPGHMNKILKVAFLVIDWRGRHMKYFGKPFMGDHFAVGQFVLEAVNNRAVWAGVACPTENLVTFFADQATFVWCKKLVCGLICPDNLHVSILDGDNLLHGVKGFLPLFLGQL